MGENNVCINNIHLNTNSQLTLLDNSPIHMYGLVGGVCIMPAVHVHVPECYDIQVNKYR